MLDELWRTGCRRAAKCLRDAARQLLAADGRRGCPGACYRQSWPDAAASTACRHRPSRCRSVMPTASPNAPASTWLRISGGAIWRPEAKARHWCRRFTLPAFGAPATGAWWSNIGGIANITALHAMAGVTGFDTGPGNCLMDLWAHRAPRRALRSGWPARRARPASRPSCCELLLRGALPAVVARPKALAANCSARLAAAAPLDRHTADDCRRAGHAVRIHGNHHCRRSSGTCPASEAGTNCWFVVAAPTTVN